MVCASLTLTLGHNLPAIAQTVDPAEKAAQEILAARERANRAADAWAEAQSQLDQLDVEIERTEREIAALEAEVSSLSSAVEKLALSRFIAGGSSDVPLLSGFEGPNDAAQAAVLTEIVTNSSADAFDDYDAVAEELADRTAELEDQKQEAVELQAYLEQVQAEAYAEIENVRRVEEQRLKDEAVRRALEAKMAEERRRVEEQARADAEAARRAAEQAAQQAAARLPAAPTTTAPPSSVPSDGSPTTPAPAPTTPPATAPPATAPPAPDPSGPSNPGTGGGFVSGIVCPVAGPHAFTDTWGAPRSGGRTHEGVDMMAPLGTPLVAVVDGYASFRSTPLGGNSVGLTGNNGNYYFYAHLDRYEGGSRSVRAGEVIGYVGNTGNTTAYHLHFEIHPGGGSAVNPTPSVAAAC